MKPTNLPCILHVEDDPNDVLLVQRAFKKADVQALIKAVNDGDEAVAYLEGRDKFKERDEYPLPTFILLDLKIPRRSGMEVLEWLRANDEFRLIPVVVLTSSRHEKDIRQAYLVGANSYLVKPVGFDDLVEMSQFIFRYWLTYNETAPQN